MFPFLLYFPSCIVHYFDLLFLLSSYLNTASAYLDQLHYAERPNREHWLFVLKNLHVHISEKETSLHTEETLKTAAAKSDIIVKKFYSRQF